MPIYHANIDNSSYSKEEHFSIALQLQFIIIIIIIITKIYKAPLAGAQRRRTIQCQ